MALKVIVELNSISEFEAWNTGKEWLEQIIEENKIEEADQWIEEVYPEGITEDELNNLLWFDDEFKRNIGLSDFVGEN